MGNWKWEIVSLGSWSLKFFFFGHRSLIRIIIKFSTSDNAILAFWLVHCISVTSHYTYVWPYMEINAANVNCRRQKNGWEKTNWVSCLQKKYKKLRTMPSQYQRKDHKVRNGSIQQYGCKISNMNNEILPIHEDYVKMSKEELYVFL